MPITLTRAVRRAVFWAAGGATAIAAVTAAGLHPLSNGPTDTTAQTSGAASTTTPSARMFPLYALKSNGHLYDYEPKGTGGFKSAVDMGAGFGDATGLVQASVSAGGTGNDLYHRMGTTLYYTAEAGVDTKVIGNGWDAYSMLVSAGDMGGTADPDLIARDPAGALWLYQGRSDGTFLGKIRIGTGGWNGMNQLMGRSDFTGDGKTDLAARATDGTLYIYPGTGNAVADAALGSRITVGKGWEAYKQIVSTGDNNGDGKADLLAADMTGGLWLFKGTGTPSAPFAARMQVGYSGWNGFDTVL